MAGQKYLLPPGNVRRVPPVRCYQTFIFFFPCSPSEFPDQFITYGLSLKSGSLQRIYIFASKASLTP